MASRYPASFFGPMAFSRLHWINHSRSSVVARASSFSLSSSSPASSGAAPPSKPRTSNPSSPPLQPVASSYYPWSKIIDELADQILEAVRLEILKMKRPDSASGRLLSHGTVQTLL